MHNLIFKLTSVALSGLDSTAVFCSIVDFEFLAWCVFICAYDKYLPKDVFFKPLSSAVTCGRIPPAYNHNQNNSKLDSPLRTMKI